MPHGRRIAFFLPFFLVCVIALPAAPEKEKPADAAPPAEYFESAGERDSAGNPGPDPAPTSDDAAEPTDDLEELEPVIPPGGLESNPDAGIDPNARYRPDGPLQPLTRSPELMPPLRKFRSFLQYDLAPESRAGFQVLYTERRTRNRYNTVTTGTIFAEYAFLDYASMIFAAPYTQKDEAESSAREHPDNASAGMKFAPGKRGLRPAMGFNIFFATGDEDLAIGSHNKGNIETYAGFLYAGRMIGFQGDIRYNAQSNLELNPPPGVKFERTWYADLAMGIRLDSLEFVLEVTRKGRVAPKENTIWTTVITPGINIGGDQGFVFSIGTPFTLSRGREYDYGVMLRGMWVF